jgi:hypothetical protein
MTAWGEGDAADGAGEVVAKYWHDEVGVAAELLQCPGLEAVHSHLVEHVGGSADGG